MITPSARAAGLAAAGAIPAVAVALAVPHYWYAGLGAVVLVLALTAADALAVAPAHAVPTGLDLPAAAYVGQSVEARIAARSGPFPVEAAIEHDERVEATSDVGGGGTLTALRRGEARIAALWLRWRGPFGLVWRQRRVPLDTQIAIVPDVRATRSEALRLFRRDAPTGETVQLDVGAGGEFEALTEYRQGMDRRAIDWKRSAATTKLVAKEYRTERNNDVVFAIDSGRLMCEPVDGVPRVDRAVSAALAAMFVALKLGDKVRLFGFDARPRVTSGAVAGVQAFGLVQRLAARIDYSPEETNYTFGLTALAASLDRRSLVMIFTEFVDPTSAELMLRTVGRLAERHLILFVLMRDSELEDLVEAPPMTADDVSRAVVAAEMLRERRIVIARLQRLGVHIVEAAHERLGSELVNAYLGLKRRNLL